MSDAPSKRILFLGDCNTLGFRELERKGFPERIGQHLDRQVINCGHTMSTVREGWRYFETFYEPDIERVFIQFGVVDSWRTFKYSPYALYYPDNPARKLARKLLKKLKKWAKALGLNKRFGEKSVVSIEEYRATIEKMADLASPNRCYLIETPPNRETFRNPEINRYNQALHMICRERENCFLIEINDDLSQNMDDYFADNTHLSELGIALVTENILRTITPSQRENA